MRWKWLSAVTAILMCVAGGYAVLVVFAGFSSIKVIPPVLGVPGQFLAKSFSWAAFYVPVYLFLSALIVYLPGFRRELVGILSFTILPFLTVSLFLRLLFVDSPSPITVFIANAFGQKAGAFLLLLLLVLELLAMFRLWSAAERTAGVDSDEPAEGSRRFAESYSGAASDSADSSGARFDSEFADSDVILLEAPPEGVVNGHDDQSATFAGPEDDHDRDEPPIPFEFPDLPPLGELKAARAMQHGRDGRESLPGREERTVGSSFLDHTDGESSASYEKEDLFDEGIEESIPADGDGAETDEERVLVYRNGMFYEVDPGDVEDETDYESDAEEEEYTDLDAAFENAKSQGEPVIDPKPASPRRADRRYSVPLDELLADYADGEYWVVDEATERAAETLKQTLEEFNIQAEVTGIQKGPVITMFEILPAPGVKLSRIVNLADNIALRLASSRVRIVAPIPGKHAVGIEVPNKHRAIVSFKEMAASQDFGQNRMEIPVALGKDITGNAQLIDLVQTPHLLIAGATGSGKSVCVNSIICSVLSFRRPDEVRMILIDPKIVELKLYNDIPHLLTPVVTEPKKAFQALQYCIYEMERRYSLLDAMGVRDIRSYNRRINDRRLAQSPLPYILIIIDEFADLMATTGKELESTLARLAAMSRAVGIHLVLATQRPSIDVITGLIKANIPSRIAFMVASKFDSRIIIDAVGAEKLLGRGDMLFTSSQNPFPTRIQGAFLSEEEVERVTDYVKTLGEPEYIDDEIFIDDEDEDGFSLMNDDGSDPMYEKALDIVVSAGKASASYLQRRLKIGYNRAARIVEDLEERGIVGPQQGSKPREVIHVPDRVRE